MTWSCACDEHVYGYHTESCTTRAFNEAERRFNEAQPKRRPWPPGPTAAGRNTAP